MIDFLTGMYIVIGIVFVIVMARYIPGFILELAFFGGIFALVDSYHVYLGPALNLPPLPMSVFIISASAITFWALMRVFIVVGLVFPPFAPLGALSKFILGGR